jgi:hypothetical protein
MHRAMAAAIFSLCAVVGFGACGGNSVTGPGVDTLAGTWRATRAQYTAGSSSIEVIAQGTSMTLTLNSSGTFTLAIVDPGQAGTTTSGTWTASSDVLTLRPSNATFDIQFDMTLSGSTLTLSGGHMQFDVNKDGTLDEAVLNAIFVRQ